MLICEPLANGTPPSAVPVNIQTPCAVFTGVEVKEIPTENFVRECRVVLQNVNETLFAFRLGNADTWQQVMEEEGGNLDPLIVSSCMYVENETSEKCVKP